MNAKETLQKAGFGVIAERMDNEHFAVELARQPLDGRSLASALDEWLGAKLTGTLVEKFAQFTADPELMAKAGGTKAQAVSRKFVHHRNPSGNHRTWWYVEYTDSDGAAIRTGKAHREVELGDDGVVIALYNQGIRTTREDTTEAGWQERLETFGVSQ